MDESSSKMTWNRGWNERQIECGTDVLPDGPPFICSIVAVAAAGGLATRANRSHRAQVLEQRLPRLFTLQRIYETFEFFVLKFDMPSCH